MVCILGYMNTFFACEEVQQAATKKVTKLCTPEQVKHVKRKVLNRITGGKRESAHKILLLRAFISSRGPFAQHLQT